MTHIGRLRPLLRWKPARALLVERRWRRMRRLVELAHKERHAAESQQNEYDDDEDLQWQARPGRLLPKTIASRSAPGRLAFS